MINKAKQRFIAYLFLTLSLVLIVISFIYAHKEHSQSNWYITVNKRDPDRIFKFLPNIPYTIESDNYISDLILLKNKYPFGYDTLFHGIYREGTFSHEPDFYRHFNLTCKDTTFFNIGIYLSGIYVVDGYYEIHKGLAEGRASLYFDGKNLITEKNY